MITYKTLAFISAFISLFVIGPIFLYCWRKNELEAKINTLSDCGSRYSKIMFNLALTSFGILETVFSIALAMELGLNSHFSLIPLAAAFFIFLASIINNSRKWLHRGIACTSLFIMTGWIVALSYQIHSQMSSIALTSGLILLLSGIGTFYTLKKYGVCVIPELVIFAGVHAFNLLYTIALL